MSTDKIPTIETKYNNITFRSRLEARWAVFFDIMKIKYYYEYEGFTLPSGWYLPDFWLPQVKMWAEVKPDEFSSKEYSLLYELSKATKHECLMLIGPPDRKPYKSVYWHQVKQNNELMNYDAGLYYSLISAHLEEGRFFYHEDSPPNLTDFIGYETDNLFKKAIIEANIKRFY